MYLYFVSRPKHFTNIYKNFQTKDKEGKNNNNIDTKNIKTIKKLIYYF